MDGMDLWNELLDKRKLLNDCISDLKIKGIAKANHEHAYKVALRKEIFELHVNDRVAWTACTDLAHGDTTRNDVAAKRLERDLSSVKYDILMEKINGLKLELRIIEGQLQREWGQAVR